MNRTDELAEPSHRLRVLHLEDNPRDAELIQARLLAGGLDCEFVTADTRELFEAALDGAPFDLILSDHNVRGYSSHEALELVRQRQPGTPVVVVSGSLGEEAAVHCLLLGAADYIIKQRPQRLVAAVQGALQQAAARRQQARIEARLRKSEADLRRAQAVARVGSWVIDIARNRRSWSAEVYHLFGLPEGEPPSFDSVLALVHPDDRELARRIWMSVLQGNGCDCEYRIIVDGAVKWLRTRAEPELDNEGRAIRSVGTVQDISEHKRAEEEIQRLNAELEQRVAARTAELLESRDSERDTAARIAAILHTVRDGIISVDGHANIVSVNPAAERTYGYAAAELIGRPLRLLTPAPFHQLLDQFFAFAGAGGSASALELGREFRGLRKDGSEFPLELAVSEMWLGDQRHFTGILRDITERKQVEQALVDAKNAAELANRRKDSFLATMSHEIRTPLGGLSGMLEMLSLTPLTGEQREMVQAAGDSTQSLLRILNDILDWSKIEAGHLEMDPQPTSIRQLVAGVANTYARVASANGVTLEQLVDPRIAAVHTVDALRLSQVLHNFLSNAIKFSPGGRVEIRAESLARQQGCEELRFSVKDTGIGIDTDVQQRLFQNFAQAGADTARMYGGTGLGLAICRRLAELLGGRIDLQSAPGRGSTFGITLTLAVAAQAVEQQSTPPATDVVQPIYSGAAAQAPRILIVDDHPVNRRLLVLQLKVLGLRGETAANGEQALTLWRQGDFAAVVTDCHMPAMDGYELTRTIRLIEGAEVRPRTAVIAWTANALAEEQEKCAAAGMDELLVKPTDLPELHRVLTKWLRGVAAATGKGDAGAIPRESVRTPVDVRVLERLVGSDPDVLRELLGEFRTSAVGIARELARACEHGQAAQAAALAHKLKSSACSVGALTLGELCTRIEQSGRTDDGVGLSACLPRFEREMTVVLEYLDGYL